MTVKEEFKYNLPYFKPKNFDITFLKSFHAELIHSFDDLKQIIYDNEHKEIVAFDTETTGLTYFEDEIVGFSFSFDANSGYYVPLRHKIGENLPIEALTYFYDTCLMKKLVLMFNVVFDGFMLKKEGLEPLNLKIFDAMVLTYNADSDATEKGLKFSSKHYLGRVAPTYEETILQKNIRQAKELENTTLLQLNDELNKLTVEQLELIKQSENISPESYSTDKELKTLQKGFKTKIKEQEKLMKEKKKAITLLLKTIHNLQTKKPKYVTFDELDPLEAFTYASMDTGNTFGLFQELFKLLQKEFPLTIELISGEKINVLQLDNKLSKYMIYYQQCPVYIDTERMKSLCEELRAILEQLDNEIFEFFGYPFNLDCLCEDTLIKVINLDSKYKLDIKLKDIVTFLNKNTNCRILTPFGPDNLRKFHSVGLKERIRITFENDKFIECSENELFLVNNYEFKKAKDLTEQDEILDINYHSYLNLKRLHNALLNIPGGLYE